MEVEAPKSFFSGFFAIAWIAIYCDGHMLISKMEVLNFSVKPLEHISKLLTMVSWYNPAYKNILKWKISSCIV